MKQPRFLSMLIISAMLLAITSCGDANDNDDTDATTADTTATSADTTANATTSAAPNFLLVRHKVKDYDKWKSSYDANDSLRLAHGVRSFVIGRGVEDPNTVFVATKVDDVEKAKAFSKDPGLKKAMDEGGVTGKPWIMLINSAFLSSSPGSNLRVMSTFKVKDWDSFKTSFESGKQFRLDNGVEDRAYGHDVDDNKKVVVFGTVLDSAKVRAYHKSDSLKARIKRAGVEGTPDRFWYRVVQSY